ncbi:MAG TPA: endo-1,4-beta-xylanase, partial [Tepidisphaeraceae bacterium]|nr:endo-1,4-beta-xylanase [Tepidisphaeraceae bacterium]
MPPVAVRRRCLPRVICLLCLSVACAAHAQSGTLSGGAFALRSGGFASGSAWTLDDNGYVGTYITLSGAATVTFQIQAAGNAAGGAPPRLSLAVDDSSTSWNVSPSSGQYTHNVYLPAGTHFVRVAYDNFTPSAGGSLTIQSLQVGGASLVNVHSNANAIAAANTYINNYRKGTATVSLTGPGGIPLLSGTLVNVDLRRHAFNFGTAVPGSSQSGVASFLSSSGQYYPNFHPRLIQNFNMVVPENAGKWANNEATRDAVQMGNVDLILNYAEQNNLRARMHNLIWGNQQPTWVNQHLSNGSAGSLSALRDEISERIDYYIGTGSATDRARRYTEVDIYNESVHTTQYWNAYGASGIAGIYNEAAAAIAASGSTAKVFVNEYNVFQWGDAFGNWYRQHIEAIRNAGGTVQGIGAQYYVDTSSNANMWSQHGAARMMSVLQGLSVTGLPIALTEFGIKSTGTGTNTQSTDTNLHASILEDAVRMMFGTPNATGFTMWGFWRGAIWHQATYGAFYDMNWNLTPVGARWQQLMAEWDTNLNAVVNPDGSISFTGFFGDYNIGGQSGFANLS